jgi:thymidylate synthase
MYEINFNFGVQIHGETMGESWLSLVQAVYEEGQVCYDEGRKRKALDNVRLRSVTQSSDDEVISTYGDKDNLEAMVDLTFKEPRMFDCDLTPSFSPGAKSYYQRLEESQAIDFVVKRLTRFPESKKAVIVFPTYEDYQQVLANMQDDYLPCLISLQFRVDQNQLNTTFNFRSMDVYQKGHGNLIAIAKLTEIIAERLNKEPGFLDGMITDAHIYENTMEKVEELLILQHRLNPSNTSRT